MPPLHTNNELPAEAVPGLAEYSARESQRRFKASSGFTDRVVTSVLRARRRRNLARWTVSLALAASVLAALGLYFAGVFQPLRLPEVVVTPIPASIPPRPPSVRDQFAEAGSALQKLTRETTDKAVAPTLAIWSSANRVSPATQHPPRTDDPTLALATLPDAARSSLNPMTNTTRKAMNRLLKDVGWR